MSRNTANAGPSPVQHDWSCLCLAWRTAIEIESLPDNAKEPRVPERLKDLSAPLRALVDSRKFDAELV